MTETHGVKVEEYKGRYRVTREFPGGRFAHQGIFGSPAEAIRYATDLVLTIEGEE